MLRVLFLVLAGVAALALWQAIYVVTVTQQAVVLRFGEPIAERNPWTLEEPDPGLFFRIPFVDQVEYLDRRNLSYVVPTQLLFAAGQERLAVDAVIRYRITEPELFYTAVRDVAGVEARLEGIMQNELRGVLGGQSISNIVSRNRGELMDRIRERANAAANGEPVEPLVEAEAAPDAATPEEAQLDDLEQSEALGIEIIDVRIRRADLPSENAVGVFRRMATQRRQDAERIRAEGRERATIIVAEADREATVIRATGQERGLKLRGEGDGQRNRIYAEAFGQDEEFFDFYRSMQAYMCALGDQTQCVQGDISDAEAAELPPTTPATVILSPNESEFFRFFVDQSGEAAPSNDGRR